MAQANKRENIYGQGVTPAMSQAAQAELSDLASMASEGKKVVIGPHLMLQAEKWVAAVRIQLRAQMRDAIASDDATFRRNISAPEYQKDLNRALGLQADDRSSEAAQARADFVSKLTREDLVNDLFTFTEGQKPSQSWGQKFSTSGNVHRDFISKVTVALKVDSNRGVSRGSIEEEGKPARPVNNLNLGVTVSTSNRQDVGFAQSLKATDWLATLEAGDPQLAKDARQSLQAAGFSDLENSRISVAEIPFLQFQNLTTKAGVNIGPELIAELDPKDRKEWDTLRKTLTNGTESGYVKTKAGKPSRFLTEQRFNALSTGGLIEQNGLVNIKLSTLLQTVERTEAKGGFHLDADSKTGIPGMFTISKTTATKITSAARAEEGQKRAKKQNPRPVEEDVLAGLEEVSGAGREARASMDVNPMS